MISQSRSLAGGDERQKLEVTQKDADFVPIRALRFSESCSWSFWPSPVFEVRCSSPFSKAEQIDRHEYCFQNCQRLMSRVAERMSAIGRLLQSFFL
jgi:hypothetical protein